MPSLGHLRASVARHPLARWAIIGALGAVAAWLVVDRFDAADAARREWGDTVTVAIADRDHRPGEPLHTRRVERPVVAVPGAAVDDVPEHAQARQFLSAGAVVEEADIATIGGPAAGAARGTAVVAIPMLGQSSAVAGTSVDVVADGLVLATDAEIVAAESDTLFVSVERRAAPSVAAAAQSGIASVVYLP